MCLENLRETTENFLELMRSSDVSMYQINVKSIAMMRNQPIW